MRAADFMVQSLKAHGIERIYCVPGESYLALLDALHGSGIQVIVCRHEGGAGFMACAEAKLTGKPAVFMVSRGPGATNASIAIHMAEQDALPVLLLIGQVSREERTRGVFQEVDYGAFFGSMAKAVYEITDGIRLSELLPRSMRLVSEGVPGPVVISMPEDMLRDEVGEPDVVIYPPTRIATSSPALDDIQRSINAAQRPLVIAGGMLRSPQGTAALKRFAEAQRLPVACTWKNQDVFDNASPLYAGHLGFGATKVFADQLRQADLIIAIGTRLGDVASLGYTLPQAPQPKQTLIHIYPDGKPLGRVFATDIALVADPVAVLTNLASEARVVNSQRESWVSTLHNTVLQQREFTSRDMPDGVNFGEVIQALQRHAPADAILTTDSGNAPTWLHRHYVMSPRNTLIGGIVGAMGLGVPAATVASLVQPHRMAVCIVGDGGVLMTGQELATAMAYGTSPKIIISDNGIYGTIRTHQEREYPGRVSGTNLHNPDFTAWAKSFGATAFTLAKGDDVDAVMAAFIAAKGACVLHVKSSAIALSANGNLPQTKD
jgi:acetolactate synthase I/II/III large subunit